MERAMQYDYLDPALKEGLDMLLGRVHLIVIGRESGIDRPRDRGVRDILFEEDWVDAELVPQPRLVHERGDIPRAYRSNEKESMDTRNTVWHRY
jgi:hypothetical protein